LPDLAENENEKTNRTRVNWDAINWERMDDVGVECFPDVTFDLSELKQEMKGDAIVGTHAVDDRVQEIMTFGGCPFLV
jgi:hypothetical protein